MVTLTAQFASNQEGFVRLDTWLAQHRATKTQAGIEATGPCGHA
ncbi:hypothetical protein [Prosthecobacter sp.]